MGGSLGTFLQSCRTQAGISVEELAGELQISVDCLHGLERDRFDGFSDEAALKECLAEYAELVDLSPGAVERLYQRQAKKAASGTIFSADVSARQVDFVAPVAEPVQNTPPPVRPVKTRSFPWAVLFILPIIVAVAYVVWQQAEMSTPTSVMDQPGPSSPADLVKYAVIPLGGGVVKLTSTETRRFRLAIDNRGPRSYRIDAQGSLTWEVTSSAHFYFDSPADVQLYVDDQPVTMTPSAEALLVPSSEGGDS